MFRWRRGMYAARFVMLSTIMLMTLASLLGAGSAQAAEVKQSGASVYVIPVKQTVESGLEAFLKRAYKEAEEAKAQHVILELNTWGGRLLNAESIGHFIRESSIPTTAFVEGKAISAGTYIALNADNIVMQTGSTIGAAAIVNGAGALIEDPKTISAWTAEMREAASLNGRDLDIAIAMVDPGAVIELSDKLGRDKLKGEVLTLTASEAEKVGYSEYTANDVKEVVKWLGLEGHTIIEVQPSIAENIARWLVDPVVMTILLLLGIAGVVIELLMPGFGVPGIIGILAFGLYFFGHYVAGFAGMESVVLFVLGIALLIIEIFVPSFGILGVIGGASLVTGVVIAAQDPMEAFISIVVALVGAIILIAIFVRMNKTRGIWNKFILRDKLTTEEGYLSADVKDSLLGQEGMTITPLRPAGTVLIGSERIDVVTSGEFIDKDRRVQVVKAEGTWVVVKELTK